MKRIENYENARRNAARLKVEEHVNTLRGQEENRFDQVFGENASLLPGFLDAMEERRRNGIVEKPITAKVRKKRVREEEDATGSNLPEEEEEQLGRKRAHVEPEEGHTAVPQLPPMEFRGQMAYEQQQDQQVARDLHSWRQQAYWRG